MTDDYLNHGYGRRAPKNSPALKLGPLLTGFIPPHPAQQDNLSKFADWAMLGNDQFGDCVAVTWANFKRLVSKTLGGKEVYPTFDEVVAMYRTQNPNFDPNSVDHGGGSNDDNGMDIQTFLEYLVKRGDIVAFAKVDHTKIDEVLAAIALFGGLWTGVNVAQNNEDEFSNDEPWDYDPSSQPLGGHSVLTGGYSSDVADEVKFITWAKETGFSDRFWVNGVEEAWVVIWPEHLNDTYFMAGVDIDALAEAYKGLTGRTFPVPIKPEPTPVPPEPTPAPVPVGPVVEDPLSVARAVMDPWAEDFHHGENRKAADAWKTYVKSQTPKDAIG